MSAPTLFPGLPSAALPEEEQMRRIGAFICRVARFSSPPPPLSLSPFVLVEDADPDERVLAYFRRVREASPVEIRVALGLSRSMTYRSLQRLTLGGRIMSRGHTKAVVYRVAPFDLNRN